MTPQTSILSIGPVGERVLPGGCIITDYNHATAKGGGGRVLGSKNFKAIAVAGRGQGVPLAEPEKFLDLALEWRSELIKRGLRERRQGGWVLRYDAYARSWRAGVKNFSDEAFQVPWGEEVVATARVSKVIPRPCFNCPIGCAQDTIIGKGPYKGYRARLGGGAEHMEGLGGMIGAYEGGTVFFLTDLCNRLGIESGTIGHNMAILYESYEKGLIDKSFADGLELKWGNADAAIAVNDGNGGFRIGNFGAGGFRYRPAMEPVKHVAVRVVG